VNGVQHTTDSDGKACWAGLPFDDYTVHENSAPSGYAVADDVTVTVDSAGDCTSGAETQSISDTPLTDIDVTSTSQDPGATKSTIACVDANDDSVGTDVSTPVDPASETVTDLKPGTYTCTIVIDP
jgi:uncharacterized surface anchored protein